MKMQPESSLLGISLHTLPRPLAESLFLAAAKILLCVGLGLA